MGRMINQNSFLLLIVIIWMIAAVTLLRKGQDRRSLLLLGGVTVALATGFLLLRPAPTADSPASELKAQIGAGKPVLLEFRSQN